MTQFASTNDFITGRKQARIPAGSETVTERFTLSVLAAELTTAHVGQVGILPAGCVPVDLKFDATDIDTSTAAAVFQIGIGNAALKDAAGVTSADVANSLMSTRAVDGGAAWGSTVVTPGAGAGAAASGAFQQIILSQPMMTVTPVDYDRAVIVKVTTAPTTAAAGTLGVTLSYRNA